MQKSTILRDLFLKPGLIRIVGAHNGLMAKLVEKAGFEGIWSSSLEVSASHAVPDANILTMSDYLDAAVDMNEAASIPVVVDVDQGYGNSSNVIHMVKKFEAAGIAGIIMEDKLFPKQNSLLSNGRQELASIPEFVGKIMAAKNAQRTRDFMVMARVEALIAGWGHEEALKRAKAYVEAGADAIMIHSKSKSPDEIIEFVDAWDDVTPLVIVPTNYHSFTEDKIKKYPKIKMVIYANHVIRQAVTSVKEALQEIKETGGVNTISSKLIPVKELFELQGTTELKENEKKFLKTGKEMPKVIIPAAGNPPEAMTKLLSDTPLCMLDINGKSLLQRNAEMLNQKKINDITVVTGFMHGKVDIENVNIVYNKNYDKGGVLDSVIEAKESINGPTIILPGDILVDPHVIDQLFSCEKDILVVIDKSYKESKFQDKKLDLVVAKNAPLKGDRIINPCRENIISKISNKIPRSDAHYEFTGIVMLSSKGAEIFKKEVEKAKQKYSDFNKWDMSRMLQEIIDNGHDITGSEISEGWIEINTFRNYKDACRMLAQGEELK